jgi:hypothetical protein
VLCVLQVELEVVLQVAADATHVGDDRHAELHTNKQTNKPVTQSKQANTPESDSGGGGGAGGCATADGPARTSTSVHSAVP